MLIEKLKKIIAISRPVFWLGPPVAYFLGLYATSASIGVIELAEMFLLSIPLSFLIYGINDAYDIETDKINPRKGGMWGVVLEKKDIKWVMQVCFIISLAMLLVAYSTMNAIHAIIMTLGIITWPIAYSMPPLRLKTKPIIDSIINAEYGYFPFALACSLSGSLLFLDYRIIAFSLCFSAVHALGTVMDMEEDKKTKMKTFATELGPRSVALFCLVIFAFNLTFLPQISISIAVCAGFAGLLALYVFVFPTVASAKIAFKLMMSCFFVWLAYFIINIALGNEIINIGIFYGK